MEDAFRFRYKVYCEEMGFLSPDDYPLGLETDDHDEDATHFTVTDGEGDVIGYMRSTVGGEGGRFPLFEHGLKLFEGAVAPPPGATVETGRIMVAERIRHHRVAASDVFPHDDSLPRPEARLASDMIQLKLSRLAYRRALEDDVRWFVGAMEPSFTRKLRRMGFPFEQIGPSADYFGEVAPYAMDLREMEKTLAATLPGTWAFFDCPLEDPYAKTVRPGEWALPAMPPPPSVQHVGAHA